MFSSKLMRSSSLAVLSAGMLLSIAACGGGDSEVGQSQNNIGGNPVEFSERGPITLASEKDLSGIVTKQIEEWNAEHPGEEVTLMDLGDSADQQRQQMIQNAQTKSDTYTILTMDVVWTAEFAANQYIDPLPGDEFDLDAMLPATVDSATYAGNLYGIPQRTDAALLYYRTDLLEAAGINSPPETWDELKDDCDKIKEIDGNQDLICYGAQLNKYEGLTVNTTEVINSAGGDVISEDGTTVTVNTSEAKEGLEFLIDGLEDGYIDPGELTWREDDGRSAFQDGKVIFLRNWPFVYALVDVEDGSSEVAGKFAVAPIPGKDGIGVSSVGGYNLAINKYAKNKGTALDFIKFIASEDQQRTQLETASRAPIIASLYDDAELQAQLPYLGALKESLENAVPRPKVVKYGDVTLAIQDSAYAALQGDVSADDALAEMEQRLQSLID